LTWIAGRYADVLRSPTGRGGVGALRLVWLVRLLTLQQDTGHVVDAANLPWWAIATGIVLPVATSVLASRRPGHDHGPRNGRGRAVRSARSTESAAPLRRTRHHRVGTRRSSFPARFPWPVGARGSAAAFRSEWS
jgi:hypothetical protein